jgi:hypothetical protein
MNLPNGTQPALIGAGIGALAVAVLGFTLGGWVTGGSAQTRMDTAVSEALVAAMTPYCVARSTDPKAADQLAAIKAERTFLGARDLIAKAGWATSLGAEKPEPAVADACARQLRV